MGLYRLRPVLSNETIIGRETLTAMQRRLSTQATSVGVNGDLFALADGRPSGILLRDGCSRTHRTRDRSSAGITLDGLLDVRRVRFFGTWRGTGQRRTLNRLNKEPTKNGISLFTPDWGRRRPAIRTASPSSSPRSRRRRRTGPLRRRSRTSFAAALRRSQPGRAVLLARGTAATSLHAEAQIGATVVYRLILQPDWTAVADAIGGGPVLVRERRPVYRSNEAFTTSQLAPAESAERGRPARGRQDPPRRRRRSPARLLGRDDDLRDGADARPARSRGAAWGSTAGDRRRSRSRARSSTVPRRAASGRSRRRSCCSTSGSTSHRRRRRSSRRTATAWPRSSGSRSRSSARRR